MSTTSSQSLSHTKATFAELSVTDQLACLNRKIVELQELVTTMVIEASIEATVSQSEEVDLVWENYGAGWGWFKADLTAKNRGPR